MGPIFNPVYWLIGLFVLSVAAGAAAVFGVAAYALTSRVAKRKGNARRISLVVALPISLGVGALAFCGLCQLSLSNPGILRAQPAREEILGVWSLTSSSLQALQEEGGYKISTHTFTFRDDGTLEMVNMPDSWLNFGHSNQGFYSGSGTWEIVKDFQGYWTVKLRFTYLPEFGNDLLTWLYIGHKKSGYYIYDFLGDPDSADVLLLEKQ